ncbi:galactolipase DONGLE, chloroplastic-like [Heracleum sosnowskyi]|uniref:Galactolipase DONGLE, chloroplastic-like n=1 Tax=Heracleum sosnowskyi TaxID=360622 RepID=A0AAD8MK01_9APIA|nr:galactolipase DONGLE, chloroplastic-like [Heracleum sosnowskyi]
MAMRVLNLTNPSSFVSFSGDGMVKNSNVNSCKTSRKFFVDAGFVTTTKKNVATKVVETSSCLARLWKQVRGVHDWKVNVVEPLDPLLQHEIIRYGEFVAACYQVFDLDPESRRYLHCKYGKSSMLNEVGMLDSGYEVTKYIYATPDINIPTQNDGCCGRWIGYIAVSSDEEVKRHGRRDVMVVFRGTVTYQEWLANFNSSLTPARLDPHKSRPNVKVGAGVLSLYTSNESANKFGLGSCREQLLCEVTRLLNMYKGEHISITLAGHSMGSSLALLLAYDIAELQLNVDDSNNEIPITVLSFGGPRVGNLGFKERCDELGINVLRIVNVNDPITKMPGVVFNENFRVLGVKMDFHLRCSCYVHVGVEIALDFLKMRNPSRVHDIETYLSLLKCPNKAEIKQKGLDIVDKVKWFLSRAHNIKTLEWREAAMDMVSMIPSQRT